MDGTHEAGAAATLGGRLAEARAASGLDRAEVARRVGIPVGTLDAWEEGRREPRANRISTLAGVLGVPLVWLMIGEGPRAAGDGPDGGGGSDLAEAVTRARRDAERLADRLRAIEARLDDRTGGLS